MNASAPKASRPLPRVSALLALALLSGCGGNDADRYTLTTDVRGIMASVVDPAADLYWDAVGWIVDAGGTTEIRPETLEEWEAVRNAAVTVAEAGNLLMMEGRAVDEGPWLAMSRGLIEAGRAAAEAAERRDEQAVFDRGAELYYACTACHSAYAIGTLRPSTQTD